MLTSRCLIATKQLHWLIASLLRQFQDKKIGRIPWHKKAKKSDQSWRNLWPNLIHLNMGPLVNEKDYPNFER